MSPDHRRQGGAEAVVQGLRRHPAPGKRGILHEAVQRWHERFLHHDRAVLENESAV